MSKSALKLLSSSSSSEEDFSTSWGKDKWNLDSVFTTPKTASYDLGTSSLAATSTSVVYIDSLPVTPSSPVSNKTYAIASDGPTTSSLSVSITDRDEYG